MDTPMTLDKSQARMSTTAILVLGIIITCIGPFASDCYLPSLPSMTKVFGSTTSVMQLTITLYLLGFALSQLVYGPLSDRFGRRIIILNGLGICVAGSLLCAIAPTAYFLLFARLLQGIGAGVTNAIFRAVMRDVFEGPQLAKLGSCIGIIYPLAPAIAPIIGGYLHDFFGWRSSFIFLFFLISSAWSILWHFLPETNKQLNLRAIHLEHLIKNYGLLLTNKIFMGFALCSSFAYAGIVAYFTASPFLLQNVLHLTPVQYGWSALIITTSMIAGQFLNTSMMNYLSMKKVMSIGIYGMLFSGILMLSFSLADYLNFYVVLIPTTIFMTCSCMIFANAMAGALHPFADMAGSAAALYGCLQVFGSFLATLLIASLHSHSQLPLAGIFILLSSISMVTFVLLINKAAT